MTENLSHYLEKGKTLHGDLCAGIVLGTRLSLVAMKALGMDPDRKNKNLIVFVETDRCIADAVQAITGCTLGHRTLKYVNYGKFSAVFYDLSTKRAVRVTERRGVRNKAQIDVLKTFYNLPDEELIQIEEVEIDLDENELPGKPKKITECKQCGELIFDGKEQNINGDILCRACANGTYYKRKIKNI